jgi:hypothetical protein
MSEPETNSRSKSTAIVSILTVTLTVVLVAIAGYLLTERTRVPTASQAAGVITQMLKSHGPTTVSFQTGFLQTSPDSNECDPRYKLLERAGIVTIENVASEGARVTLKPNGTAILKEISGVRQSPGSGSRVAYVVPLADMRLVDISNIAMLKPNRAIVRFTWEWNPNPVGESFDAFGALMKGFSKEDRAILADQCGVRSYSGKPTLATVALVKTAEGWSIAND